MDLVTCVVWRLGVLVIPLFLDVLGVARRVTTVRTVVRRSRGYVSFVVR